MRLILIDEVMHVGKRGDVVDVAAGYGRNYLIPKSLAVPATPANLKKVEEQRVALAKREAKMKDESEILAAELGKLHLVLSRRAGDTGLLFGSVTSKDLGELLEKNGIHLDRRKILLEHPIKQIGNFTLQAHPHPEVSADLLVSVIVEGEEPVARVLKRGPDSDEIVAEVEAKLREFEELAAQDAQREEMLQEQEEEEEKEAAADQKHPN